MIKIPLSVVLPTYNVEEHIARALDSLINQTYTNFEIIIVDDCGSDSSIDIARSYAQHDPRIKIIKNPKNLGTYHARRIGAENASGDYVLFLDPDDELNNETLSELQKIINTDEVDIIFYGVMPSNKRKWYEKAPYMFPVNLTDDLLVSYFSNGTRSYLWGTAGKIYKTSFIKKIYGELSVSRNFRFIYAEDVFLLVHAMLMRPTYACVYYQGYVYHDNETSITQTVISKGDAKIMQYDFMVESLLQEIKKRTLSKKEIKIVKFLKRKLLADRFLLIRNSGSTTEYYKCVAKSFRLLPNTTKAIRVSVFILSFGQLRL